MIIDQVLCPKLLFFSVGDILYLQYFHIRNECPWHSPHDHLGKVGGFLSSGEDNLMLCFCTQSSSLDTQRLRLLQSPKLQFTNDACLLLVQKLGQPYNTQTAAPAFPHLGKAAAQHHFGSGFLGMDDESMTTVPCLCPHLHCYVSCLQLAAHFLALGSAAEQFLQACLLVSIS